MPRMSAPSAKILIFSCARSTLDSLTDELHDSVSARFGGLRRARTADDDETRFPGGEVQVEAHGTLARDGGEQVGDVSVGGVPNLRRAAAGDGGADRLRFRSLNCHRQFRVAVLVLADLNLGPSTGNDRRRSHWVLLGCVRNRTDRKSVV